MILRDDKNYYYYDDDARTTALKYLLKWQIFHAKHSAAPLTNSISRYGKAITCVCQFPLAFDSANVRP